MKKWMISLAAAMAMLSVGCGKDDCEKRADVWKEARDEACKGKSCWACDCEKQGKMAAMEFDMAAGEFVYTGGCTDMPKVEIEEEIEEDYKCEGEDEKEAKKCLDNKAACKKDPYDGMVEACKASAK